ncbi:hypothetical protein OKW28_000146 [Paraburkholderia sp. 40]
MVDPSCAVAADRAVDDPTVGKPEQERMSLSAEFRMAGYRAFPAHNRTGVLDDEFTCAKRLQRKDAATMNARATDRNSFHR